MSWDGLWALTTCLATLFGGKYFAEYVRSLELPLYTLINHLFKNRKFIDQMLIK